MKFHLFELLDVDTNVALSIEPVRIDLDEFFDDVTMAFFETTLTGLGVSMETLEIVILALTVLKKVPITS